MKKAIGIIACIFLLGMGVAYYAAKTRLPGIVRERSQNILRERFHSEIEFGQFNVSLFPLKISGDNLVFRHKGRTDVPPLITIKKFAVEGSLTGFLRTPAHVTAIRLDGLQIQVPRRKDNQPKENDDNKGSQNASLPKDRYPVVVDEIAVNDSQLQILPKTEDKEPLEFLIHHLKMHSVGLDRSAPFQAALSNPKPEGEIQTAGMFGPWQPDDPGQTPVSGDYTFEHADMSVFKGLMGMLSSKGKYNGVLERIMADGETMIPDFGLTISGHTIPLHTRYHAIIDGTNGDTLLQPVDADFLKTSLTATGGVVKVENIKGKTIQLDVVLDKGRMEDLLRLAVKSDPAPLTGSVAFRTKFLLPPGKEDVADRLRLDGNFVTSRAAFSGPGPSGKLKALSRRAQGKPDEPEAGSEIFDLAGKFHLRDGVIRFSQLNFRVEGAAIALNGTYGLRSEALDFRGTLRLDAKLSETVTGVKSIFLKIVDPFFSKKGAGTLLPIKITGTRDKPSFGLAFGGSKAASDKKPEEKKASDEKKNSDEKR
jgi:hypothetical protein